MIADFLNGWDIWWEALADRALVSIIYHCTENTGMVVTIGAITCFVLLLILMKPSSDEIDRKLKDFEKKLNNRYG